jgi:hypothetical protein
MDPQAAGELVEAWLHVPGAGTPRDHGPVSRSVRALAPDSDVVGVGDTALGPAMAVLLEGALLVLEVRRAASGDAPAVIAHRLKLDDRADLAVEETYEQTDSELVRRRAWKLDAAGVTFRIRSAETNSGPDGNERLARAVAAELGWAIP